MKGLHDNPALFPILPGREIDQDFLTNAAPEGNEYREAWEYLLSHELTEAEGSAFWHAIGIQAAATRRTLTTESDGEVIDVRPMQADALRGVATGIGDAISKVEAAMVPGLTMAQTILNKSADAIQGGK